MRRAGARSTRRTAEAGRLPVARDAERVNRRRVPSIAEGAHRFEQCVAAHEESRPGHADIPGQRDGDDDDTQRRRDQPEMPSTAPSQASGIPRHPPMDRRCSATRRVPRAWRSRAMTRRNPAQKRMAPGPTVGGRPPTDQRRTPRRQSRGSNHRVDSPKAPNTKESMPNRENLASSDSLARIRAAPKREVAVSHCSCLESIAARVGSHRLPGRHNPPTGCRGGRPPQATPPVGADPSAIGAIALTQRHFLRDRFGPIASRAASNALY